MKRHLLPYYIFIHAHVAEVSQSKKKLRSALRHLV